MDVFCDAREVMRRFERYVIDLRRLFTFHGLTCGAAENFCELAVKLEESRALRLDLPALLRNIRDLEQEAITADEMLTVVALASGGEELVEGRASSTGLMRTIGMLQMMLAGVGTWAETNGDERTAKAVTSEGSAGEERVFLELAIEELRLQLSAVSRRMGELAPQRQGQGAGEAAFPEEGAVAAASEVEAAARVEAAEREAAERERVEEAARAAKREAAERAAAERATAEREMAEREMAVSRAAADAAMQERERVRAWPLEERVSSLPAMRRKTTGPMGSRAVPVESENGRRGRMLRLGGVAAGLLLATMGIYGSLRSASARAEKEGGRAAAGVDAGGAGGKGAAAPAAVMAPRAGDDAATAGATAGGVPSRTDEARMAKTTVVTAPVAAKAAPRVEAAKVTVPKAVGMPAEVAAKNRRDDAAVESALATRPKTGKFLFVPADVMEKHLLSARKPVGAQGAGRVVLNAFIAKDGTVSRTDVVEGPPGLINSAVAAVSWRRYRPFLVRGEPAAVVTPVTVSYGTQ